MKNDYCKEVYNYIITDTSSLIIYIIAISLVGPTYVKRISLQQISNSSFQPLIYINDFRLILVS